MSTVNDILRRLLPNGSNFERDGYAHYPVWPPDAFAVAATIVNLSGCYCDSRYITGCSNDFFFSPKRIRQVRRIAVMWGRFGELRHPANLDVGNIPYLHTLWRKLLRAAASELGDLSRDCRDVAITLMMIADAASEGMGFLSPPGKARPFADALIEEHKNLMKNRPRTTLPYVPVSVCRMVPKDEVCVQPKTMTAQVGCTLRSLSHHLALLPSSIEVEAPWCIGLNPLDYERPERALNLLLVPFPFKVGGMCFIPGSKCFIGNEQFGRFFQIEQKWLRSGRRKLTANEFAGFVLDLIREAEEEVNEVNGVVLPELALDDLMARGVAAALARNNADLELFACGVLSQRKGIPTNCTRTFLFTKSKSGKRRILSYWQQSKHHRWRLNKSQIQRYNLGNQLPPEESWWELANIDQRECRFYVFRNGMSLATLICEDLARIDPVQTVIRSVGPNLVIALLMDGPQLEQRWSGRYSTVLADDPGSAVLTLTSLGLIRRSARPGDSEPRQVALWKGAEGIAEELTLPKGHHALLVTLTRSAETNYTLDGRSDNGSTYKFSLAGIRSIQHKRPPKWVAAD